MKSTKNIYEGRRLNGKTKLLIYNNLIVWTKHAKQASLAKKTFYLEFPKFLTEGLVEEEPDHLIWKQKTIGSNLLKKLKTQNMNHKDKIKNNSWEMPSRKKERVIISTFFTSHCSNDVCIYFSFNSFNLSFIHWYIPDR